KRVVRLKHTAVHSQSSAAVVGVPVEPAPEQPWYHSAHPASVLQPVAARQAAVPTPASPLRAAARVRTTPAVAAALAAAQPYSPPTDHPAALRKVTLHSDAAPAEHSRRNHREPACPD